MADTAEDLTVTYGVKELLAQISTAQTAGFASLTEAMLSKADKADVARINATLDAHDVRLRDAEQRLRDETAAATGSSTRRRSAKEMLGWVTAVGVATLGAMGTWIHH